MNPVHKPQRKSTERALKLHIRRNRQNMRDSQRGYRWAQFKQAVSRLCDLPAALVRAAA